MFRSCEINRKSRSFRQSVPISASKIDRQIDKVSTVPTYPFLRTSLLRGRMTIVEDENRGLERERERETKKGEKAPLGERHRLLRVKERGERRTKSRKGGQVSTWYLIPFENVANTRARRLHVRTYVRTCTLGVHEADVHGIP